MVRTRSARKGGESLRQERASDRRVQGRPSERTVPHRNQQGASFETSTPMHRVVDVNTGEPLVTPDAGDEVEVSRDLGLEFDEGALVEPRALARHPKQRSIASQESSSSVSAERLMSSLDRLIDRLSPRDVAGVSNNGERGPVSRRAIKMVNPPDKFDGTGGYFKWREGWESSLRANRHLHESELLTMLRVYLVGLARDWYDMNVKENTSLDEAIRNMNINFGILEAREYRREYDMNPVSSSTTLAEVERVIKDLEVHQRGLPIPQLTLQELAQKYVEWTAKIHPHIGVQLAIQLKTNPSLSYRECADVARALCLSINIPYFGKKRKPSTARINQVTSTGGNGDVTSMRVPDRNGDRPTRLCYKCGQPGHMAKDHESKPSEQDVKRSRPGNGLFFLNRNGGERKCYQCGQVGHIAKDHTQGGRLHVPQQQIGANKYGPIQPNNVIQPLAPIGPCPECGIPHRMPCRTPVCRVCPGNKRHWPRHCEAQGGRPYVLKENRRVSSISEIKPELRRDEEPSGSVQTGEDSRVEA